ncbi:rhodanese-like domain-containing protein [Synechococcus sp. Tobar12-5m-g]|uniref:rhodanese-like domain-containing protein n=1 Tax=Synechococcus sp. Cruz CV-v-12 TaxID=2823728 RepID=UPI0020CDB9FB|nr:rhodanese-like domain-containing protein [Synechococcus sp. Cruz CV-v-12]MCP9773467.1 rhodanese-like domain-containing protein [Synechococcus sp. Tobar12-5m-g]
MAEGFQQRSRLRRIGLLEARRLIWEGAELLDARGLDEFTISHLEGARNLSSQAGTWEIRRALPSLDAPIICYSNGNGRATALACRILDLGYTYVFGLEAGLNGFVTTET